MKSIAIIFFRWIARYLLNPWSGVNGLTCLCITALCADLCGILQHCSTKQNVTY